MPTEHEVVRLMQDIAWAASRIRLSLAHGVYGMQAAVEFRWLRELIDRVVPAIDIDTGDERLKSLYYTVRVHPMEDADVRLFVDDAVAPDHVPVSWYTDWLRGLL